jgi:hypothetical protein
MHGYLLLSAGTTWEFAIKVGLRKLVLSQPFQQWMGQAMVLMGFLPILADSDLHPKRHGQCCGFGHEWPDLPTYFLHRGLGYLEDKLIMDLHDELGVDAALDVPTVYADHRPLDDIGRRALHRRIDGGAFGVLPAAGIARVDLGQV